METIRTGTDTVDLLSDLAHLLNLFGPGSPEVEAFISRHEDNSEFVRLGRLSCALKRALATDQPPSRGHSGDPVDIGRISPSLGMALENDCSTMGEGPSGNDLIAEKPMTGRSTSACFAR